MEDPELAARAIADLLAAQLTACDLTEDSSSSFDGFIIKWEHGKVNYLDEDAFEFTDHTVMKARENDKYDVAFTKPQKRDNKNYAQEKEYRLCFWVFNKNLKQQSVKMKPKILAIPSILDRSSKQIHSLFQDVPYACSKR